MIFAGIFLVVHEGGGQFGFAGGHGDEVCASFAEFVGGLAGGSLGYAVDAIHAAIHIHPRQQLVQPARGDFGVLRHRHGGGGEVARRGGAQAQVDFGGCFAHGLNRLEVNEKFYWER